MDGHSSTKGRILDSPGLCTPPDGRPASAGKAADHADCTCRIVSFEFTGSLSNAREMLESWGPTGRVYAGLSLGTDYLFLVAYSIAISLGCVLASRGFLQRSGFLSAVGVIFAWAIFGAALLDSVENYALIQVLLGAKQSLWPAVARICAIPKFLIVGLGLLYVLLGAVTWVAAKAMGSEMHAD